MGFADLHIHVKDKISNRNGDEIGEILKSAVENEVYTLAFTSHNTLQQYTELYNEINRLKTADPDLYVKIINNMKFAIGFEIDSRIEDGDNVYSRHMLAYNIPVEKINDVQRWLDNNTNKDIKAGCQLAQLKHFKATADRLNIPYESDRTLTKDIRFAGGVFAEAVKDKVDSMLVDVLSGDNQIAKIFEKELAKDEEAVKLISTFDDRKEAYKAVINNKEIMESNTNLNLIKHLYYQIIDLRLFASQSKNENEVETEGKKIQDVLNLINTKFNNTHDEKLDQESIELINAELYSKLFNSQKQNEKKSEYNYNGIEENENYDRYKIALYYSISNEIYNMLKSDKGLKKEFGDIKKALEHASVNFADIINRTGWFNSVLVRPGTTPFSYSTIMYKPKLEEVIQEIHEVHGIVEVAHPCAIETEENIDQYMEICRSKGVDGFESLYVLYKDTEKSDKQTDIIQEYCKKHNLIYMHGGTDYHIKTDGTIGLLRNGKKINEDELAEAISLIPAKDFMEQMQEMLRDNEYEK